MTALLKLFRELPASAPVSGVDHQTWLQFCESSERHGLAGLAHHELARLKADVPAEVMARLQRSGLALTARNLRLKRLLLSVLDACVAVQVPVAPLKGLYLASRYWPDALFRPATDVDVLVARPSLERVQEAMVQLGLKLIPADSGEDDPFEHHHHVAYFSPAGTVEVHYRLLAGPGGAAMGDDSLQRATVSTWESRPVLTLAVEEELVYLLSHAAQHLFQRVSWLYDVKLMLLAHPALQWGRVVEIAQAANLRTATHAGLVLVREALGAPVDPQALKALAPSRAHARLVRAAFSDARLDSAAIATAEVAPALRALLADSPGRLAQHLALGATRRLKRAVRTRR